MLHYDTLTNLCRARDLLRERETWGRPIDEIAGEVGLSYYHFIRLFRAVFGDTPKQTQIKSRLERAKHLLIVTDRSVTDISLEVGYASLGTFSHVFADRFGIPPSAYRQRIRSVMDVPGKIPKRLIPGCFSLMCGPSQ